MAPAVTNQGTLKVTAQTLDFQGAVTGTGTDTIYAGTSTLEWNSAVSSSTTVGSQNIGFTGGGTVDLTDPTSFHRRDVQLRGGRHGRASQAHGPFPSSRRPPE